MLWLCSLHPPPLVHRSGLSNPLTGVANDLGYTILFNGDVTHFDAQCPTEAVCKTVLKESICEALEFSDVLRINMISPAVEGQRNLENNSEANNTDQPDSICLVFVARLTNGGVQFADACANS
jgi:hypothetical protein